MKRKNISKLVTKIDNPKYGAYVGASVITTLSNYGYSTYLMKHKYDSEGGVVHKHNFQKLTKINNYINQHQPCLNYHLLQLFQI